MTSWSCLPTSANHVSELRLDISDLFQIASEERLELSLGPAKTRTPDHPRQTYTDLHTK